MKINIGECCKICYKFVSNSNVIVSIIIKIYASFFVLSTEVLAAEANGCGSGWSTHVVPDKIRLLNCSMKGSCDTHDKCYSECEGRVDDICEYQKCRPKGKLYGSISCATDNHLIVLGRAAQVRRAICDDKLAFDIATSNPASWGCQAVAIIYRKAVKLWGDDAFNGYSASDQPLAWAQTQEEYDKAIADFIEFSDENDFRKFVESAQSTKPNVNFCGRLMYSKELGLTNVSNEDKKPCSGH